MPLWSRSEVTRAAGAWGLALAAGLAPGPAAAQADSAVAPTGKGSLEVSDQVYTGWKYFQVYCSRCHGDDALGTMAAPDLTYSVSEEGGVTADSFAVVVRQGAMDSTVPTAGCEASRICWISR